MKDRTMPYICQGGPFNNKTLRISANHPYTFTFNLKSWKGRYYNARIGDPTLYWEPA